ncbi:Tetratricopeptide-like helical domain superfamily [Sesbania bispinosa]|nr:Tetratricopeptide-like helical domain superfamily [Sesbania bispinosa]
MVGDIFGKSWGSAQSSGGVGIVNKNPNLFGDLVSSALGQGSKTSSANVPLKNAAPTPKKSSFSMGSMADSLPKTGNTPQTSATWGSSGNFNMNANKTPNLGGPSLRNMGGGGGASATGISSNNKDPFSSLAGFGSKQSASLNSAAKAQKLDSADDGFGDFQNASKPSSTAFPSSGTAGINVDFTGSTSSNQTPVQASGGDPMDMFFTSSSASSGGAAAASQGFGGQPSSEMVDWGLDSEFGGGDHDVGGTTTELEGLPPPPSGVSGSTAKGKGMDNYKQGQFADAIKWLSWAVILLEKAGDNEATVEVLSCRASCYKEVGEYKKAVADCTKILEDDEANVSVLVQRALLYESMEKYRLGAEDLRTVLKIDPSNRIARSTIHRLNKMAD